MKVGLAHSAAQTRERLWAQLEAATQGNKDAVRQMQTNTGTKDKVAQYWIDILLKKAKIFKCENPDKSQDEITMELLGWLRDQPGDKVNPLLGIASNTLFLSGLNMN